MEIFAFTPSNLVTSIVTSNRYARMIIGKENPPYRGKSEPNIDRLEVKVIELKDWVGVAIGVWANIITTISMVVTIRNQAKKKPPSRKQPHKHKRKGR